MKKKTVKIIKQIGFEGRTTIPLIIREEMGLEDKDFISFELSEDGNSVTLRREFICDGCPVYDEVEEKKADMELQKLLKEHDPVLVSIMKYIIGLAGDAA